MNFSAVDFYLIKWSIDFFFESLKIKIWMKKSDKMKTLPICRYKIYRIEVNSFCLPNKHLPPKPKISVNRLSRNFSNPLHRLANETKTWKTAITDNFEIDLQAKSINRIFKWKKKKINSRNCKLTSISNFQR